MTSLNAATIIIAYSLLVIFNSSAKACQFEDSSASIDVFYKKATTVFTAHLNETRERRDYILRVLIDKPVPIVEGKFEVVEELKGKPPTDGIVRDLPFGPGNCSIPLLVGLDYLFMWGETDGEYHYVGMPTGSRPLHSLKSEAAQKFIAQLRELKDQK